MKFNFIDYLGETPWNLTPFPSPYQEKGCLILYRTQVKTAMSPKSWRKQNNQEKIKKTTATLTLIANQFPIEAHLNHVK